MGNRLKQRNTMGSNKQAGTEKARFNKGQLRQFVQDFNVFFSGFGFVGPRLPKVPKVSKYKPHQGVKECTRRIRQNENRK